MPYAISLFSGAMGLDLGVEQAGFTIRACVEFNHNAAETIRLNTNIPVLEGDINNIPTEAILHAAGLRADEVDLVVGGPPCQAFSTAGRQRGLADFRGNVIIQYLRVVHDIHPRYFILENVRGLLSAKLNEVPEEYAVYEGIKDMKGSVLWFLTKEFERMGYTISHALFNSALYGVPEQRERMVIFGCLGAERIPLPLPTHDGKEGRPGMVPLRTALEGLPEQEPETYIPLRENSIEYMALVPEGGNWRSLPKRLQERAMGRSFNLPGGKTGFYRRLSWEKPSPTLVTSPTMPATLLCHPTLLRPLSIHEYSRIQQFPDNWQFAGNLDDIYKQIGNAVPVGLGYMAGCQVMAHMENRVQDDNNAPSKTFSRYKNTTDLEFQEEFQKRINNNYHDE